MSNDSIGIIALIGMMIFAISFIGVIYKDLLSTNKVRFAGKINNQEIEIILVLKEKIFVGQDLKDNIGNEIFKIVHNNEYTLEKLKSKIKNHFNNKHPLVYENKTLKTTEVKIMAK